MICIAQSSVFLYFAASRLCIRVLTTSNGVLPNTLAAPAIKPNTPVISTGTDAFGPLLLYFLDPEEDFQPGEPFDTNLYRSFRVSTT